MRPSESKTERHWPPRLSTHHHVHHGPYPVAECTLSVLTRAMIRPSASSFESSAQAPDSGSIRAESPSGSTLLLFCESNLTRRTSAAYSALVNWSVWAYARMLSNATLSTFALEKCFGAGVS